MSNVYPLRPDMTPNPLHMSPSQQEAAHSLAVRFHGYHRACDNAKNALLADERWASVACWAGMLRDTQIATGVTLIDNEYLRLTKMRAKAKRAGDEEAAWSFLLLMAACRI